MKLLPARWCLALLALGCAAASAADTGTDDVQRQLADAQDRLSTALHSYSLLQDENDKLKAQIDSDAAERAALQAQLEAARQSVESLKAGAAAGAQLSGVREQLRQARDQVSSLAQQNYELRAQLTAAQAARK